MKAYSFKWNAKEGTMVFTDAGRHIVRFSTFEDQITEMVKLFTRKDISIRIDFVDTEGKKQMHKVSFQNTSVIIKNKKGEIVSYCGEVPINKKDDLSFTFNFPMANRKNIYVWYEKIHNGKCVVMYGSDKTDAKPIDLTKVKFYITYKNEAT